MMKASVAPSVSEAIVRLHADGSANVLVSTVEMGQGARTVMAQIAAEVLALPLDRIRVVPPDTSITPYDQTSSSSRSTTMVGRAVQEAAQDVVDQLRKIAAEHARRAGGASHRARRRRGQRRAAARVSRPARPPLRHARRRAHRPRRGGARAHEGRAGRQHAVLGGGHGRRRDHPGRGDGRHRDRGPTRPSATSAAASTPSSARPRTRARSCRGSATRCSRRWCTRAASS